MTQQNELKALALRVLARSACNTPCNEGATNAEKPCNKVGEFRGQMLHTVAAQIIEISLELGIKPEIGLGFFNALDWEQIVDGVHGLEEIRSAVKYAKCIHEQMQSGIRLVEVSKLAKNSEEMEPID